MSNSRNVALDINDTAINTKLDTIATNTANIKVSADSVNLNVDDLEVKQVANTTAVTLLNTTNSAKLDHLSLDLDGVNTKLGTIETDIEATNTKLGTIETDIEATNTALGNILSKNTEAEVHLGNCETKLGTIETDIEATNTALGNILSKNTEIDSAVDAMSAKLPSALNSDNLKVIDSALDTAIGSMDTNNQNKLDHLSVDLDGVNTKLGTIETDIEATNTALGTIDGVLDNILVKNTAGEVHLGNIETKLGTIETDIEATNSLLTTIDGVLDASLVKQTNNETLITASNALLTTIDADTNDIKGLITTLDGVLDNVLTKNTEIDTAVDAMSAKLPASLGQKANASSLATCRSSTAGAYDMSARTTIGTASTTTKLLCDAQGHLQVDVLSGGGSTDVSALSTHAKQDTIIGHIDGVETLLGTIDEDTNAIKGLITTLDAVADNQLTKLGEIETTNNANQVLLGTIDADTNAIKTAVQLIDGGYGDMTTATIMNASVAESSGEGVSSTITKLREIENIGFAITAPSNASYSAFIEYSVDNSLFFQDTNLNFANTLSCKGTITSIGRGFRYFRVRIINNHNAAQTFVVKASY